MSLCVAKPITASGDADPIDMVCDVGRDVIARRRTAWNGNAVVYSDPIHDARHDDI